MDLKTLLLSLMLDSSTWFLLLVGLISVSIVTWYMKHKKNALIRWPIVDALPSLLQNAHRIHEWTVEISNSVGMTIVGRGPLFGLSEVLFTCDPRNVEYMVKTNFSNYPKGPEFLENFDVIGNGIFNVDFEEWTTQRRMAHTVFTSKNFRNYITSVSKMLVEDALLPLLAHVATHETAVDVQDVFLRYAFDGIFTVIFGRSSNYLSINFPDDEFAKAIDEGTDGMFLRHVMPWWKILRFFNLGAEKKLAVARKTIDHHLEEYIASKREELRNGVESSDLLASYITSTTSQAQTPTTDTFLRDQVLSFLFAGRDSTGTSLTWFFYLISKNPQVEGKILEELRLVHAKKENTGGVKKLFVFESEDLKGLVYLHAALTESLRLYPPLPMNLKMCLRDDILPDGTVMKKGMKILISVYAMARMESVWGKDCLEFKPERWIDEDGMLSHVPMQNFFVFNVGPRTCIGKDMAFTQIKLAAAAVLINFHVEVVNGHNVRPQPSLVLHLANGLMVKIKKRI
ncbi:hypothetical protein GIB67_014555 [Kingdonia uniflora]|uniref:Cytochrome P450 n=1 Tax=Kingdonia uniflora TaxID=39325 RepID=A0A7J7LCN0_9MAGN|nr:hypothetical protein GIB67_014555 [Kingdonia uniflora]